MSIDQDDMEDALWGARIKQKRFGGKKETPLKNGIIKDEYGERALTDQENKLMEGLAQWNGKIHQILSFSDTFTIRIPRHYHECELKKINKRIEKANYVIRNVLMMHNHMYAIVQPTERPSLPPGFL